MASILAVVSKAIFEKQGGKALKLGQVWTTSKYVSANPNLRPLADGGSLFLVTVRPPDERLWLVAVLDCPKFDGEGWSAAANTTAARDITPLLPKLKLKSGQGVHPEKGKMGMSLQTPRELAPEDVVLLGGKPTPSLPKAPGPSVPGEKHAPLASAVAAPPGLKPVDSLPGDDEVLGRLPSVCAEALREAMKPMVYNEQLKHIAVALQAISFPEGTVYAVPSSLTPEQQLVAHFMADHTGLPSGPFALPQYKWTRQAWLKGGRRMDEPLEIEADGVRRTEPIWRAIQLCQAKLDEQFVARFPLLTLMDVFVELWVEQRGNTAEYVGHGGAFAYAAVARIVRELKDEGRDWAPGAADRLLSIESEPMRKVPVEVKWPVFLALARGGVTIEPRWNSLLPIGANQMASPSVECAKAIPDAARTDAILRALGTILPWDAAVAAIDLVDAFPSEELARWAFEHSGQNAVIPKRSLLQRLAEVGKRRPLVAATLVTLNSGKVAPVVLHFKDLLEPKSTEELSASQQKQLRAAGKRYDNLDLSAADRLSDGKLAGEDEEGGSFKGFLEIWTVTDRANKPLYDAYLYMVDSGTIFKRGTTMRVAEIVQGGVECTNEVLEEALEMAIHERPKPKRA